MLTTNRTVRKADHPLYEYSLSDNKGLISGQHIHPKVHWVSSLHRRGPMPASCAVSSKASCPPAVWSLRLRHSERRQETESEEEPSWELSEDLREFTGDPGDRKAQLLFKQLQQARRCLGRCRLAAIPASRQADVTCTHNSMYVCRHRLLGSLTCHNAPFAEAHSTGCLTAAACNLTSCRDARRARSRDWTSPGSSGRRRGGSGDGTGRTRRAPNAVPRRLASGSRTSSTKPWAGTHIC